MTVAQIIGLSLLGFGLLWIAVAALVIGYLTLKNRNKDVGGD